MLLPAALPNFKRQSEVRPAWLEYKEPAARSTTAMILQERDSAGIGRISPALWFKIAMKIQANLMVL
ncbi:MULTISPECIES: hypothetical protein [unclassified Haematobacter]|uniref:hypothetical protein n=1 Tax=unclassified Haematobacter TaxID=2640585 RepID=UPI0025C1704D|nr:MULTISPECIES: hypothetical protein [unclassified Haematobacter]